MSQWVIASRPANRPPRPRPLLRKTTGLACAALERGGRKNRRTAALRRYPAVLARHAHLHRRHASRIGGVCAEAYKLCSVFLSMMIMNYF